MAQGTPPSQGHSLAGGLRGQSCLRAHRYGEWEVRKSDLAGDVREADRHVGGLLLCHWR